MALKYVFVLAALLSFCSTEIGAQEKINWMTWDEVIEKSKVDKRKVFIDVYTDWCGWCKKMDKTTFADPNIIALINQDYYAIKFDAEMKQTIVLNGTEYKYVQAGRRGYHELAAQLLRGKMSYPSIVFLNEDLELIQPIPGYQNSESLEMIASYFAGDFHETTPWRKYTRNYKKKTETNPRAIPVGN